MSSEREIDALLNEGRTFPPSPEFRARARVNEVMIYLVQFRSSLQANLAEFPLAPTASSVFSGDVQRRALASPNLVARLARQTGGGYFVLGQFDDVNATFSQVMRELHYQYVLGFTPERADGRVHELEVRVDKPDLQVRARQSYLAPPPPRVATTPR